MADDRVPTIDEAPQDDGASSGWIKRKWDAPTLSATVAAFGVVVAVVALSVQSCQAQAQLRQANELGWGYQGAQQCVNYRSEVLKLWGLGLNAQQIKSWLALEKGGTLYNNPGDRTAYDDRAEGCGTLRIF